MAVALSGSIVLAGSITGSLLGTASYSSNTEFFDGLDSSVFALTSSLGSFTSSLNDFSSSINTYTASNNANIAALNAATASLYNATASLYSATASLYGATSSLFTYSASATSRINALDQYTASLNTRSASFACINSTNNFACVQYFSNASNAVSFTSTGSLYSDGGMRLTKDLYVSGTSYFNNVTIFGTQSVNYITSSQLNIASNIITVNTATPTVRFGGLAVYDSGSLGTGLTGSILWDSEDNQWIYSNPSGSAYDSALFLVGPRNSGVLGGEAGISCNFLSKGNGMHHMTSSGIFEDGSRTCFYGSSIITSTGVGCFAGAVCAPAFVGGTISGTTGNFSGVLTVAANSSANAIAINGRSLDNTGTIDFFQNNGTTRVMEIGISPTAAEFYYDANSPMIFYTNQCERLRITGGGNVGIGTISPSSTYGTLTVAGTGLSIADDGNAKLQIGRYSSTACNAYIKMGANACSLRFTNNTDLADVVVIEKGGNVGIGISSPQRILTVYNSNSATLYQTPTSGTGANDGFYVGQVSDVSYVWNYNSFPLAFGTAAAERMRISSTGIACFACQVCSGAGFYASSLQSGITIDSTTNGDTIIASRGLSSALHGIVRTVGQNGITCAMLISTRDSVDGNLPASVNALWGLTNHAMVIATNNAERMRITNAGRVGIGNQSPVSALVVSTTTQTSSLGQSGIVIEGADTLTAGCVLALAFTAIPGTSRARAAVGSVVGSDWGKGNLTFYTRDASDATALTTADERMRITSGGCVIVNGTSASSIMTIYPAAGSADTLTYRTTGNSSAGALYAYSDGNGPSSGILHNVSITSGGAANRFNGSFSGWTIAFDSRPASDTMTFNYVNTSGTYITRISLAGNGITCFGCAVSIGAASTSAEANLFLGAQSTIEGGQLVLQKGTSCSCATHLDNYQDSFRVLVGTDTGTNGVHMLIDHKTRTACFYGQVQTICGINSVFYNGSGARYNFTSLNTAQTLVGICANNGILVIRDHTTGGTGAFLIDPNMGVICMASNIPATVAIAYNSGAGSWFWCLTSGSVPRCLGYGFYGA